MSQPEDADPESPENQVSDDTDDVDGDETRVSSSLDDSDSDEKRGLWDRLRSHPKIAPVVDGIAPYVTPLYFAGGVVFDAVTLSRYLSLWTLGYVLVYATGVAVCLALLARERFESHHHWIDRVLHFCLGATFSALIALYFRSANHLGAWFLVGLLLAVMVWNEWAAKADARSSTLVWGVYAASLVMLFNFLLPYLFGSIWSVWFYFSIALVLGALYALRDVLRIPTTSLVAAGLFSAVLTGLYFTGAIPPVPLVMRQNLACIGGANTGGEYTCEAVPPRLAARVGWANRRLYYREGERISVLSAVSGPRGLSTTLEHRWARAGEDGWTTYDTIEVRMAGGRDAGWRFHSFKRNVEPGLWRVSTAVPDGRIVGSVEFELLEVEAGGEFISQRKTRKLR